MRIGYYLYGTLVTTATTLSAPTLDAFLEQVPITIARAFDSTASLMKREARTPRSENIDLAKKAFIRCPELSGLSPMLCSTYICGGQSCQRPGYCNDDYPSVRHCKCTFLLSNLNT